MPSRADAKKKILAKKQNARSALNLLHVPLSVILPQYQMLPQLIGPIKSTSNPNATMNMTKSKKSIGQWMKDAVNGRRKRSEKRMPMAATTSVYMNRFLDHADWCLVACRYSPVRPATVALKASSPMRRQRERMSERIMMAVD